MTLPLCGYASNNASDKEQLLQVIEQTQNNTKQAVKEVLADSGYSSYENYEQLEKKNIEALIPDQEYGNLKQRQQNPYHKINFVYDKNNDQYICPQGKPLIFYTHSRNKKQKAKSISWSGV